jgi:capsular polysaccharide biosynthesis protein
MEQNNFSFGMLVDIIRKRFKLLAIVALIALVGSAIFSGPAFIPPKYKSVAIVYPINLEAYGSESLTEQLLQLFQSTSIRDSLIEKFDLAEVYELNPEKEGFRHNLLNEFNDHILVSKTNFESVKIEVYDVSPERARDMAQEMVVQLNYKARKLQRDKALEQLRVSKNQLEYQANMLDSINIQLSDLRKGSGLLDYQIQTERITEGYLKMLAESRVSESRIKEVRKMLDDLGDKGGVFMALSQMSEMGHENYNSLLIEYQRILRDVNQELTYTHMVATPEVADKKSLPVRWLIVLSALISSMLVALVVLLLFEKRIQKD